MGIGEYIKKYCKFALFPILDLRQQKETYAS